MHSIEIELSKSDIIRLIFSFAVVALLVWLGLYVAKMWFPPPCGERVVQWAGGNKSEEWQCGANQHLDIMENPDQGSKQAWVVCRCKK